MVVRKKSVNNSNFLQEDSAAAGGAGGGRKYSITTIGNGLLAWLNNNPSRTANTPAGGDGNHQYAAEYGKTPGDNLSTLPADHGSSRRNSSSATAIGSGIGGLLTEEGIERWLKKDETRQTVARILAQELRRESFERQYTNNNNNNNTNRRPSAAATITGNAGGISRIPSAPPLVESYRQQQPPINMDFINNNSNHNPIIDNQYHHRHQDLDRNRSLPPIIRTSRPAAFTNYGYNNNPEGESEESEDQGNGYDSDSNGKNKKIECNFRRLFIKFSNRTTIHGLPNATNSGKIRGKLFWGIIFIGCLISCVYQLNILVEKYFRYEKNIELNVQFEALPFPSVTFCSLNPFENPKAMNIGKIRSLSDAYSSAIKRLQEKKAAEEAAVEEAKKKIPETPNPLFNVSDDGEEGSGGKGDANNNVKKLLSSFGRRRKRRSFDRETRLSMTEFFEGYDGSGKSNASKSGITDQESANADGTRQKRRADRIPTNLARSSLVLTKCRHEVKTKKSKDNKLTYISEQQYQHKLGKVSGLAGNNRPAGHHSLRDKILEQSFIESLPVSTWYKKNQLSKIFADSHFFAENKGESECICVRQDGYLDAYCAPFKYWTNMACLKQTCRDTFCGKQAEAFELELYHTNNEDDKYSVCVCNLYNDGCYIHEAMPVEEEWANRIRLAASKRVYKSQIPSPEEAGNESAVTLSAEELEAKRNFDKLYNEVVDYSFIFENVTDEMAVQAMAKETLLYISGELSEENKIDLSYEKQTLIQMCSYNGEACNMDRDFRLKHDPFYGNCYTYNWDEASYKNSTRAGAIYGLRVMVQARLDDYLFTTDSAGVRLAIHDHHQEPFPEVFGQSAPNGFMSSFGVKLEKMNHLAAPYGDCTDAVSDDYKKEYIFKEDYSVEGCYRSCYQHKVLKMCSCGDPRFPVPPDRIACRSDKPEERKCIERAAETLGHFNKVSGCNCPKPCREHQYSAVYSGSIWPAKNTKETSSACGSKANKTCLAEFKKNSAVIEVFYERLNFQLLSEIPAYGFTTLVSDIGGIFGLWMGASVITFLESFTFFIELLFHSTALFGQLSQKLLQAVCGLTVRRAKPKRRKRPKSSRRSGGNRDSSDNESNSTGSIDRQNGVKMAESSAPGETQNNTPSSRRKESSNKNSLRKQQPAKNNNNNSNNRGSKNVQVAVNNNNNNKNRPMIPPIIIAA